MNLDLTLANKIGTVLSGQAFCFMLIEALGHSPRECLKGRANEFE
jgi:hypothetical protein